MPNSFVAVVIRLILLMRLVVRAALDAVPFPLT
jgi:hypothetical protein